MPYKILIADDEADIRELLGYNLRRRGFEVWAVADGRQAIEMVRRERPDLLLLDLMMPEMDGFATLRKLKSGLFAQSPKIVFLTASASAADERQAIREGAAAYLHKSIRLPQLIAEVERVLAAA